MASIEVTPAMMNNVQGGEGSTAGVMWLGFKDRKLPRDTMGAGEGEVAPKVEGAGQQGPEAVRGDPEMLDRG